MEVMILCGGRGTRLGTETEMRPKPLVEIGGRPILWHIMKHFAAAGHTDFILCLGYKGEMIKRFFLEYEAMANDCTVELGKGAPIVTVHSTHSEAGWRITLADTGLDTQTGARVKRAARYVKGERFLMTYGDGVSDVDLSALVEFHTAHGRVATVTAVHPPARFGELGLDGSNVTVFSEKPQTSQGLINGGFLVFEKRAVDFIPDGDHIALEQIPLSRMAEAGQLGAYRHDGFWQCVDTVRELELLRGHWDRGKALWKTWPE